MNLQPSQSFQFNDRRELFAWELALGGHGQIPLSGTGTFYPTSSAYVFYAVEFLTDAAMASADFRTHNFNGDIIYSVNGASYDGFNFPAGYTWTVPLNSITLNSGTGIAYQYLVFPAESCSNANVW